MIIVTGGAGLIGSHLVQALNQKGFKDIIIVDDLTDGTKIKNLTELTFLDYLDCTEFYKPDIMEKLIRMSKVLFHQGANSNTTEWNGKSILLSNYSCSKQLLEQCSTFNVPFIYASSASVYGNSKLFSIEPSNEHPLNPYAFSKWQFDRYVAMNGPFNCPVAGLRYFNVYGPNETHKKNQASPFTQFLKQYNEYGFVKVFEGSENFHRDFISVFDVVKVNLFMWQKHISGLFNVGTGKTNSFLDVAHLITNKVKEIPFPEHLKGVYQDYTCADITSLRKCGFDSPFLNIKEGYKKMITTDQIKDPIGV